MAMSDVIAVTRTSDGTFVSGRTRVKQLVVHTSAAGSPQVVLKDGGASNSNYIRHCHESLLTISYCSVRKLQ